MDKDYEITKQSYEKSFTEYDELTKEVIPKDKLEQFSSYLKPHSKVLDMGCSSGRHSNILFNFGFEVIGIDIVENFIILAKKQFPKIQFKIENMINTNFENNSFDGIWANASFLHIKKEDIEKGFVEISRLLKSKGILFISFKEGDFEELIEDKRYNNLEKFFSYYTYEEIENLLKKNNFEIIEGKVFSLGDSYNKETKYINIFARKK